MQNTEKRGVQWEKGVIEDMTGQIERTRVEVNKNTAEKSKRKKIKERYTYC